MSFVLLGILNSQATAGGVPAPAFLSSAPLWLDAADASTITESGGSVSQWDNKGTGSNFVQASSADQPTTGVSTLNDLNVLDFDSNVLGADGATGEFNFLHDGSEQYFIVLLMSHTSNGAINAVIDSQNLSGNNRGLSIQVDDRSGEASANEYEINVANGSGKVMTISNGPTIPTSFTIMSQLINLTATASDRINLFRNNTDLGVNNTQTGAVSTADSASKLGIGDRVATSSISLFGQIAELIIVSGADATETNRQAVVDYLNTKWGVF